MLGNKGMFLESIINRTNLLYAKKGEALVFKRSTNVHISNIVGNKVSGFLGSKNYVDYYGFANGRHFEFEAKSTKSSSLSLRNIKKEQLDFLLTAEICGSVSFFIIYFYKFNRFFLINTKDIENLILKGFKSLHLDVAIEKGQEIKISYPGVINYLEIIILRFR